MVHDMISDFVTRIRNGQNAKLLSVKVPNTKLCLRLIQILYKEGYVRGYAYFKGKDKFHIELLLKYFENQPAIQFIHRISKPGKRIYWSYRKLKKICMYQPGSTFILSTSHGIVSSNEALVLKVGGEVLCWIK